MKRRGFLAASALAAARAPRPARAEPVRRIGYLGVSNPAISATALAALREGLAESGHTEGRTLAIDYRWADGAYDRLPALAADLVARNVELIVTTGSVGVAAAQGATARIPIVFFGGDVLGVGLVASIARPGGNLTGISILSRELNPKRLELLGEFVPPGALAALVNPGMSNAEDTARAIQATARSLGRAVIVLKATTLPEIEAAFAAAAHQSAAGLLVASDPFFNSRRAEIVAIAANHRMPAMYEWREYTDIGGLVSYGPSYTGTWRQVGVYAGRVLQGEPPATLPIQQPARFELVVNLLTAKALGLTISPTVLARADEVIE